MINKIIKELEKEINKYGVRWLNGKDLGSVSKGSNVANMAVDLMEKRLEIVCKEDYFCIIFGNKRVKYNELLSNSILNQFVIINDGIRISFSIGYQEEGKQTIHGIGEIKNAFTRKITNYTFDEGNIAISSDKNIEYKKIKDVKIVNRNKDIITYFFNQFKENDFYKDWVFEKENVRVALSQIKNI